MLDLCWAYLLVHIDKSWPFQTVKIKGQRYCLTRLGFGLNVVLENYAIHYKYGDGTGRNYLGGFQRQRFGWWSEHVRGVSP